VAQPEPLDGRGQPIISASLDQEADPPERQGPCDRQIAGEHGIEKPLGWIAMVGGVVGDGMISEKVEVSVTARLVQPDRSLPSTLPGSHIEPTLAGFAGRRPCLADCGLFDFQSRSVRVLEIPARPIG
jgi:hypothetical protein